MSSIAVTLTTAQLQTLSNLKSSGGVTNPLHYAEAYRYLETIVNQQIPIVSDSVQKES
jgi:hypothetical protein